MVEIVGAGTSGEGFSKGGSSYLLDASGNITESLASSAAKLQKDSAGNVIGRVDENSRPIRVARVALAAVDTGGGLFAWQNPESAAVIIDRVELDVTTKTTDGVATVDVGVTATSAVTSADTLIDGLDVGAAAGVFDNITDKGINGKSRQRLASGKWVTGSKATGALAGIVGYAYIHYHLV